MKFKAVILFVGSLILCGFLAWKFLAAVAPRFSFSFPLHSGNQEIRTELPAGRYALVISTNSGSKTFGVIPPRQDYTAQISLEVRTTQGVLARETNAHYVPFSLSKATAGKVQLLLHVENGRGDEVVMLHLGRGF